MPGTVLAVGIGAVTASGCVWYVPALADLRAGADRPASRRLGAAACVTAWATVAAAALLLLGGLPAHLPAAVTAAGAGAALALRIRATLRHRQEQHEAATYWHTLAAPPPPSRRPRLRAVFATTLATGLATGLALAAALLSVRTG
ncbi:hypothetical protein [Streptomyces sp. NPDC051909]|uniref:hypothetical protein n=1 Tax=Streptomyces sp. NPDC051909 TaxID=3154944 RepID=UPI00341EA144